MYARPAYLDWAIANFPRARYDLATSGMTPCPLAELGPPESLDDPAAWRQAREGIATYHHVDPAECVAALGAAHAIWLLYAALLAPGDVVAVETPGYEPLVRAAEGMGIHVVPLPRPAERGHALDPALVDALPERLRLVVVSNLHNPSGVRAPDDTLAELAARLVPRGAYLLVDEVYAPFDALTGPDGTWPGSARRLGPNVVTAGSLTKCYGLGSHRFGWALGPPEVIARVEAAGLCTLVMLPLSHAAWMRRAFDRLPYLAERARGHLAGKRARVQAWASSRHDIEWSAPAEGLFGLATVRGLAPERDLLPTLTRAFESEGLAVSPGTFFGVPHGFRLGWAAPLSTLEEGLGRLSRVLNGLEC